MQSALDAGRRCWNIKEDWSPLPWLCKAQPAQPSLCIFHQPAAQFDPVKLAQFLTLVSSFWPLQKSEHFFFQLIVATVFLVYLRYSKLPFTFVTWLDHNFLANFAWLPVENSIIRSSFMNRRNPELRAYTPIWTYMDSGCIPPQLVFRFTHYQGCVIPSSDLLQLPLCHH